MATRKNKLRCEYRHPILPGQFRCAHRHPLMIEGVAERVGFLDIECSHLEANFGIIYSWCVKPMGKPEVLSDIITERTLEEEKRLLQNLLDTLQNFTTVITYYGTGFDIPFIRTRCLYHELDFPRYGALKHVDLYYIVRSKMKLHSNRLQVAGEFLGYFDKTPLRGEVWLAASLGDQKSFKYILDHNKADVVLLEKVYRRMRPFMKGVLKSV